MIKKSTQVAFGGLASALCLLLMFMTGIIPFTTYAIPAIAGMVLIAVSVENGHKTAWLVYTTVALLSFIVPDREAAVIFIAFFGYYPILKQQLDKMKIKLLSFLIKLIVFNVMIVGAYLFIMYVLGLPNVMDEEFGQYSAVILLVIGNFIFVMYDKVLDSIILMYVNWFRPRILGRL